MRGPARPPPRPESSASCGLRGSRRTGELRQADTGSSRRSRRDSRSRTRARRRRSRRALAHQRREPIRRRHDGCVSVLVQRPTENPQQHGRGRVGVRLGCIAAKLVQRGRRVLEPSEGARHRQTAASVGNRNVARLGSDADELPAVSTIVVQRIGVVPGPKRHDFVLPSLHHDRLRARERGRRRPGKDAESRLGVGAPAHASSATSSAIQRRASRTSTAFVSSV